MEEQEKVVYSLLFIGLLLLVYYFIGKYLV